MFTIETLLNVSHMDGVHANAIFEGKFFELSGKLRY